MESQKHRRILGKERKAWERRNHLFRQPLESKLLHDRRKIVNCQMDGERLYITYGERNLIRSFRSVKVETRSDPATPKGAPSKTWSDNLLADFDPSGASHTSAATDSDDDGCSRGSGRQSDRGRHGRNS